MATGRALVNARLVLPRHEPPIGILAKLFVSELQVLVTELLAKEHRVASSWQMEIWPALPVMRPRLLIYPTQP